jgi:Protein of unknown function (DUF4054)
VSNCWGSPSPPNSPVVFDQTVAYPAWLARYPEFCNVSYGQALGYFDEACLYCANSTLNPAFCTGNLPTLLNMLTAHIAKLYAAKDCQPAPEVVGMVNSATEGSVTVSLDMGDLTAGSPSQPWYMQTKYGASYWYATARFRTAQYFANPTIVPSAVYTGRRFGFGGGLT